MPRPVNLHIECTNRGTHEPWPFGESIPVVVADAGQRHAVEILTVRGRPERKGGPVEFRCPICGRNPRETEARWHAVCEAWRDAGGDTLDISVLP